MALAPQQFCVRWNSYHTNLQAVFPRLLSTEHFADVTLACENRQLRCHKLVLSACSAYFERLLVHNPCKHPIVFMKDMRFSEMQALVDFMYKGEVNVTQDELPSLLKSAEALQIRGLCSGDTSGLTSDVSPGSKQNDASKDYTVATEALLAQAQRETNGAGTAASSPPKTTNGTSTNKKRKSEDGDGVPRGGGGGGAAVTSNDVKEETVEEDGLYYGELDHDNMEFNEDDESGKPGSSLSQPSAPYLRVKPESELFFSNKQQNMTKTDADYITKLSKMNAAELKNEFKKYGFSTSHLEEYYSKTDFLRNPIQLTENDYYKSWLEQNGELEVSLLKSSDKKKNKLPEQKNQSEVELIPKNSKIVDFNTNLKLPDVKNQLRRRGRPPIFKNRNVDIGDTVLKADLDQFLEGKEVSSSGLSRKDLERIMMGKFNPNRRYSNEAMWAALMDVKKGGSIYRAAQTHKVPRKSLRNWMKRCHIKSSFPMPQQLKQFVENSKKLKEYKTFDQFQNVNYETGNLESKILEPETSEEFGKHFLFNSSNTVSSDEEIGKIDELNFPQNDGQVEKNVTNDDKDILNIPIKE